MTNYSISKIKKYSGLGLVFLLLVFLDQIFKYYSHNIFRNYFFAFSLPVPKSITYTIYIVVLFFIFKHLWKNSSKMQILEAVSWVLILSGATSNIIERLFFGYVKDWFYISLLGYTGIYNLADGYILMGIILLVLTPSLQVKKDL